MKKVVSLITLFFLLVTANIALAQSNPTVEGKVKDENGAPIPYATVALYSQSDSTLVQGAATDVNGEFKVQAQPAVYYLQISFLSYQKKTISDINLNSGDRDLGEIKLTPGSVALEEAVVETERSQMELKLDKRVFTVGQDLSNQGGSASEVLDNVPSVTVDVEGNISLRGSNNVQILIDGKPSGMVGSDPAEALRQIPGDLIERVEVITNPSARYQAEGEVGIINIILKKDERKGLNGTFTGTAGYPENFGASFNLNFRREKINWFAQYGIRYRDLPGGGNRFREVNAPDTAYIFRSEEERSRGGISHNFRAGADFYLKNDNSITISGLYQHENGLNTEVNTYRDFDIDGNFLGEEARDQEEIEIENTVEAAFNHKKKFDGDDDHTWETIINFYNEEDTEDSDLTETSDDANVPPLEQDAYNTENEQNFLFQSDYIRPIGEEGKFETGMRISNRIIENDYSVRIREQGGEWMTVDTLDNNFRYDETIYAGYMMYGNALNKFNYQFGVRSEYSVIGTELIKSAEENDRDYINFFPSIHLGYEFNEQHTMQLTYSRRLSRPRFRSLLPFSNFSDDRDFYRGNPDLNPEFTDSYEAGYLYFGEKGSFLSSVYYRHRTGVIERIAVQTENGNNTRFPVNLSVQDAYGLEFNFSYQPVEWYSVNSDFNFYRAITVGEYNGQSYNADTYTWYARMNNKFSIDTKTDAQISARYRAPRETTQGRVKALYSIDLSIARDVLDGKGTLAFNVRDVLNSRRWRQVLDQPTFYEESEFQWRARQFILTFTYRLNQKKMRGPQEGGPDGYEGDN
ncbi:TonB-dependent receptor domain-containing protein [Halocola ammonii]